MSTPDLPAPDPSDAPRIACCIDDSPGGLLPVAYARRLWGPRARLTLVHVAPRPLLVEMIDGVRVPRHDDVNAERRRWLADVARREPDAQPLLLEGLPGLAIHDWCERTAPDAVVVACHGRRGLQRAVMGSVTRHLLEHCTRPVLVVRATDDIPAVAVTATTTEVQR